MRGIPWFDPALMNKNDDWSNPLADGLKKMFHSTGTKRQSDQYKLQATKKDQQGNTEQFSMLCLRIA